MALSELTPGQKALARAKSAGYLDYAPPAQTPEEDALEDQYMPEDLSGMTEEMSNGILRMLNIPDGEPIRDSYPLENGIVRHAYVPGDNGKTHHYWRAVESFSRKVLEVKTGPFTFDGRTEEPLLKVTTPGNRIVPENGRQAFAAGVKILSEVFLEKPAPQA